MKIAFTGGSTGGHVFPIRSLIQYIKSTPEINAKFDTIYWFGENNSMEQRTCTNLQQQYDNLRFETVIAGKIRREYDLRALTLNIVDLFRFIWGVIMMVVRFPQYQIDVVFCKGGFVSLPLTIAAWIWRKKIYVHESDTRAGLATHICGMLATHNFSGFPGTLPNTTTIGQIMSNDLITAGPYQYGDTHKTNLLLMGGSLGAMKIYQAIHALSQQSDICSHFNIITILGAMNHNMRADCETFGQVIDFADQSTIGSLYQRADICVCRGGTTSLGEMEIFGIRKLIVPLPITHDQQTNAQYYVDHHGDHLIMQDSQIISSLEQTLQQYIGYHKDTINTASLYSSLNLAKKEIFSIIIPTQK